MYLNKEIITAIQTRLNNATFYPNEILVVSVWDTPRLTLVKAVFDEKEIVIDFCPQEGDFLADIIYDGVVNETYYLLSDIHNDFEFGEVIDQIKLCWPKESVAKNVIELKKPEANDLSVMAEKLATKFNVKGKK